jgi:pimeloyl-ACP methyl ester carboxylesterase
MDAVELLNIRTSASTRFARKAGTGPPLLLLHGLPQTHLMGREACAQALIDFFWTGEAERLGLNP